MKIVPLVALMAALSAASLMSAQDGPTVAAPANSLYIGADGKYESAPDTALFQFNISVQEASAQEAYQRASQAA